MPEEETGTHDNTTHEDGGYGDPDSAMRWDMEEEEPEEVSAESSVDDFNE